MTDTATDAGISMTRVFDAPRDLVFAAWTEPARFAYWFGGTGVEVPTSSVEMDLRPGGQWKATMLLENDNRIDWRGEFREVEAPARIVMTITDRPEDVFDVLTVELRDLGDGRTEMSFSQTGSHMDAKGYEGAMNGWSGFFEALSQNVAG
jgi:uncharacterized protein YndB with AHSA1/START domain